MSNPPDTLTRLMIGDKALSKLGANQLQIVFAMALEALGTIGSGRGLIDPHNIARETLLDVRAAMERFAKGEA